MMELWELTAREQIRDLVARYNANGDSARFDEVVDLFWPDAVMELEGDNGPHLHHGADAIRSIFTGAADQWRPTDEPPGSGHEPAHRRHHIRHHVSTLLIDLENVDRARGYCYFQVLMPHGLDHWGRYFDRYERREGTWKFIRRKVTREGLLPQTPPLA